jgi:hypothetical protein
MESIYIGTLNGLFIFLHKGSSLRLSSLEVVSITRRADFPDKQVQLSLNRLDSRMFMQGTIVKPIISIPAQSGNLHGDICTRHPSCP